jgi:hypothetical protein
MDPRDARLVLQEARGWTRRGLLSPEAMATLEAEYAPQAAAAEAEGPGIGLAILYALAGVLLGAACVAVPILLDVDESFVGWWLLALGVPLLGAASALWRTKVQPGLVDALFIGSLVPLTIMGAPGDDLGRYLAPLGLIAAAVVTWLPRASPTVPVVGSIGIYASSGILAHQWFREPGFFVDEFSSVGSWVWMALAGAQLATTIVLGKMRAAPWRILVSALLCIGLVVPFVMIMDDAFPSQNSHFYEIAVGLFELALLGIGLALRERGLVLGGAIVVAGDAIVFAFDIDVLLGIVVLVGVAFALVGLATWLRRRGRAPERT